MKIRLLCSILAAWPLLLCNAFAQGDTASVRHLEHEEVMVTGHIRRGGSSLQAMPYASVKRLPVATVADALRLASGVNIKDYGGIGGLRAVSVRGLGASHTLISYDGIQVSGSQAGQVDISRFSFNPGQQVSLRIAGAGFMSTAREYASPATLCIQTSAPEFREGRREAVQAVARAGSFGYFGADAVYSCKVSDNQSIRVEGEFATASGDYPFTLSNFNTVTRERRINSDVANYHGEADYYGDFGGGELRLKAYAYESHRGLPGSVVLYNKSARERLSDRNAFFQGSFKIGLGRNAAAKIYAKANYSNSLYKDFNVKYRDGKLMESTTQRELYLSEVFRCSFSRIISSATFSVDETRSLLESNAPLCPLPARNTLQSALDICRNFGDCIRINLSGVYTRVREQVERGSHFRNLDKWRPSARVCYMPDGEYIPSASIAYKSTFRVPAFSELYCTSLGTTGLRPEQAHEFAIDLGWRFLELSAYRNYVTDKIVAIPTTYVWRMANYGKAEITGLDIAARKQLSAGPLALDLSAKYTYQKALNLNEENPELHGGQIPYTPVNSGSFSAVARTMIASIGYSAIWSGKRYSAEYNIPENEVDAYIEQSLSASREIKIRGAEAAVKFSCINLAGKQYDVIKYYPMPGRHWQLEIRLNL